METINMRAQTTKRFSMAKTNDAAKAGNTKVETKKPSLIEEIRAAELAEQAEKDGKAEKAELETKALDAEAAVVEEVKEAAADAEIASPEAAAEVAKVEVEKAVDAEPDATVPVGEKVEEPVVVTDPDNLLAAPKVSTGYLIEDNIPMPKAAGGGGKAKYPWDELAVGQSFAIDGGKIKTAYTMASHAGKKLGKSFASRSVEGGVRIWRTA